MTVNTMDHGVQAVTLIVDTGSTDDTEGVIERFIPTFPHVCRTLYVSEPGNGAVKNAAIRLSRGEILAFTEDWELAMRISAAAGAAATFPSPRYGITMGAGRMTFHDISGPLVSARARFTPKRCFWSASASPLPMDQERRGGRIEVSFLPACRPRNFEQHPILAYARRQSRGRAEKSRYAVVTR